MGALPSSTPFKRACTVAPDTGVPPVARVIVPLRLPGASTVNATPLLGWPDTVTTTGPLEAPAGTGAMMRVSVQLVGVAGVSSRSPIGQPE